VTVIALRTVADSRACLITGTSNAGQFKERNMTSAVAAIPQGSQFSSMNVLGRDFESRTAVPIAPTVFVVDDDIRVRESLELLIRSQGWESQTFESARDVLMWPRSLAPKCLILAYTPPFSNCLEIQKRIARTRPELPIIVISDCADIPTTIQVFKAGALDFLIKPCNNDLLLCAIRQSLTRSRVTLEQEMEMQNLQSRYALLTLRERQVMALVASGLLNKQVGGELGISEITVKFHRGNLMRKMKADSFAELVNMAARLRITGSSTVKVPAVWH
jgi:FixJ family two-component response regulator